MLEPTLPTTERKRFTWKWSWKGFFVALVVVVAAAGAIQNHFFLRPFPPTPPEVAIGLHPQTARPFLYVSFSSSQPPPGYSTAPRFGTSYSPPDAEHPDVQETRIWTMNPPATSIIRFEPNDSGEMTADIAGRLIADLAHPTKIAAGNGLSLQRTDSASDGFRLLQPGKYEFIVYTLDLPSPAPAPKATYEPRYWQQPPPNAAKAPAR